MSHDILGNPFEDIDEIPTSQELLDLAFSKAMKIRPPGSKHQTPLSRSRDHELNRINTAANVLVDRIGKIISQFPTLDKIHPFYQEMAELFYGLDNLKINLGRLQGASSQLRSIQDDVSIGMINTEHKLENQQIRKRAFGRYSSLIYQLSPNLIGLAEIRQKLISLPGFNPLLPTVVITGIPNAGKSSFIKIATSGTPEIASYPFTTKEIIFGHRKLSFLTIQFVDTPGLLDRSLVDRNEIELQAILALKHLADILVFFFDPSDDASCSVEEQINLLEEIVDFYPSFVFLVVITKSDLVNDARISFISEQIKLAGSYTKEILVINSQSITQVTPLLQKIEALLKETVLQSYKFRDLTTPKIDEDFLPPDEDQIWIDYD